MNKEIKAAMDAIKSENEQEGVDQEIHPPTEQAKMILMLDGVTLRPLSPMQSDFFGMVGEWREAFYGKNIYHPSKLEELYNDAKYKYALELRRENFWPHPPWADSDLDRTALYAWDTIDEGEAYFWWRTDNLIEPLVVEFFGGSVTYYACLMDYLKAMAYSRDDLTLDLLEELSKERDYD